MLAWTTNFFLDIFVGTPYHVMVRFGMWEQILEEPEPEGEERAATRAVWRYARGIALAVLGRVDDALAEQELYLEAKAAVPETRLLFNNPVNEILQVAAEVLAGNGLHVYLTPTATPTERRRRA